MQITENRREQNKYPSLGLFLREMQIIRARASEV